MTTEQTARVPFMVRATRRVEEATALDGPVRAIRPIAGALVASPRRKDLLQGTWLGHAIHPPLTDLPIGFWTSAFMLDLVGGRSTRAAAQQLVGMGILAAVPTAITGAAEWVATGRREQRVGVVHAAANSTALMLYVSSYRARRRGRQLRGVMLGMAGATAATVGGHLGGHLTEVRKVSSWHPAFEDARMPAPRPAPETTSSAGLPVED